MKIDLKVLHNLNMRERLIIAVLILFTVGYSLYILIIPPAFYKYKLTKRQYYVQKQLMKSRKDKMDGLPLQKNNFNKLKTDVMNGRYTFFTEEEALDFLNNLDEWAAETRTDIERIRPESTEIVFSSKLEENVHYKSNIVEVILTGEYNNILKLFEKMVTHDKLLGISEVDLKHTKEDPSVLGTKFNLSVYIYGTDLY